MQSINTLPKLYDARPRQIPALLIVVLAHGAFAAWLMHSGGRELAIATPAPIEVRLVATPPSVARATPSLPAPPPPSAPRFQLDVPRIEIAVAVPAPAPPAPPEPALPVVSSVPAATSAAPEAATQAASPAGQAQARIVGELAYREQPRIPYPRLSRRLNESGIVMLVVEVDEHGNPVAVAIERSSGFERLDLAALAAVRNARFVPYRENGVPHPAVARVPVRFTLDG